MQKNQLNSTEFENHLSNFETVSLELKYPSSSFDEIYMQLLNLKKKISTQTRVIICASISGVSETDMKFQKDTNIEIIRLDKTVTKIAGGIQNNGGSFSGCLSLTHISIPSSVTEIGDFAFN